MGVRAALSASFLAALNVFMAGEVRKKASAAVVHARDDVDLAGDAGGVEAFGVFEVLVMEQVQVPDPDPRRGRPVRSSRRAGAAYGRSSSSPGGCPR